VETISKSIYDFPRYYDLVFGNDCAAELKFLCDINDQFLKGKAKRLFEPACGTGRLLYRLAKRGFDVEGIDLNEKAIEFCNARFKRHDMKPTAFVADMVHFKLKRKCDLSFNTINSFRHLTDHLSAVAHLQCMAQCTKKGGLYLVGIHLTPTTADPQTEESWAARRGNLSVLTHMWAVERNSRKRMERFGLNFDVYTPTKLFRIEDELHLRSYTPKQFSKLVSDAGEWEVIETYDFAYDINSPIEVDSATEDVVYVLRRT